MTPGFFKGELPVARPWMLGDPEQFVPQGPPEANGGTLHGTTQNAPSRPQGARTGLSPSVFSVPERDFAGIGFTGFRPPDTEGDVGPNHYVQVVNAQFQVFDKNGTSLAGPANINTLFTPLPGTTSLCETTNRGDPIVLYDQAADRWLLSQFAFNVNAMNQPIPPFEQCIAISATPDPRPVAGYFVYDFNVHNTKFPDYPKFGVWPDAYYMSTNQFGGTIPPDTFMGGGGAYAFDRTNMLAGTPATFVYFDTTERQMLPSDLDGATAPPANSPNFFLKFVDGTPDRLEVREFHVDFTLPLSTFLLTDTVLVAAFDSNMCGDPTTNAGFLRSEQCIPQPGVSPCPTGFGAPFGCLATLPDRVMFRLQYRNFGAFQTLVTNHTVDENGADHAGIFWHELRDVGAGWALFQEGVYAPDATHRWMGSIAMNGKQDIALRYSVSSTTIFPSIRYAGRLSTDPADTLPQGENALTGGVGTGAQTACQAVDTNGDGTNDFCRGRWGDYSAMSVDPVDDCTFWYTSEYIPAGGQWQTRVGAFRFPSCVGPPTTLTLVPKTSSNPVDAQHCVTATVTDFFGDPTPGITVRFTVTGSVNTSGSQVTDANGQATFCYTGPPLPGADVISAYADTDNDNVQGPGEPSDTAAKTWTLPSGTALCEVKITNGGWIITDDGDRATFGGNAKESGSLVASGNERFQDHGPAEPMSVKSIIIQAITCNTAQTQASIFGQATINGTGVHNFRIDVQDNGEPGKGTDHYRMRLDTGYDSGDHILRGGNVQIH